MNKFEIACRKFLARIISTRSLSGQEKKLSRIIAAEMRSLNYDEVRIDRLGSVVGRIGSGKKKILYDAHIDTVGVADLDNWKTDPFKAVEKNGIIYGRGAVDDKGCVAAMIYAGARIKNDPALKFHRQNDFSLYVSASVQEEVAEGYGINFLLKKTIRERPDCVIIGEPSDLKIIRGHKGRAEIKLTIKGRSSHASIPEKGQNAIYKALPVLNNIIALNKKYQQQKPTELGRPVISVTYIETRNASLNTIPDNCSIYLDRRTIENENKKKITAELKKISAGNTKIDYLKKYFNAWVLPEKHPLVQTAVATYQKVFQKNPEVALWPFCTNGSFTMGERKIPTIGFGPGKEEYCHSANEQISFWAVLEAIKFYSLFPLIFCEE